MSPKYRVASLSIRDKFKFMTRSHFFYWLFSLISLVASFSFSKQALIDDLKRCYFVLTVDSRLRCLGWD